MIEPRQNEAIKTRELFTEAIELFTINDDKEELARSSR